MNIKEALQIFNINTLNGQDDDSLKKIYHKLAGEYHPDKGGNGEDFIQLRSAYSFLKLALLKPHEENDYRSETEQNTDSTSTHFDYKAAFFKASTTIQNYEQILNKQIEVIQETQNKINAVQASYENRISQIREKLKQSMAKLNEKKNTGFIKFMLTGNQMSEQDYIHNHNLIVSQFNIDADKVDEEYIKTILNIYQESNRMIIGLLNEI
jgi:curved DNA-binding protein CbpA